MYHGDTSRISKSGLDEINVSPAHYFQKYLAADRPEFEQSPTLLLGSAFHKAVLEPQDFHKEYIVLPENAPKKPTAIQLNAKNPSAETLNAIKWREQFNSAYANHTVLTADMYDTAMRMRDAVYKHPSAKMLFGDGGVNESTVLFNDPETGAPCKCRPDRISQHDIVVDLKSTEDASPEGFGRSAFNYRYHVQAPFYIDGINVECGYNKVTDFVFVAVEKKPPYAVACYFVPKEVFELGRVEYLHNLETYMECLRTGEWPAYSPKIIDLRLPGWAFKR